MKHLNQLKLLRRGLYRLEAILRLNRKLYSGKKIVDKVEKKVPSTPYELWKDKRQKENSNISITAGRDGGLPKDEKSGLKRK
jgi:hypothetical protein